MAYSDGSSHSPTMNDFPVRMIYFSSPSVDMIRTRRRFLRPRPEVKVPTHESSPPVDRPALGPGDRTATPARHRPSARLLPGDRLSARGEELRLPDARDGQPA